RNDFRLTPPDLEQALQRERARGKSVKAVLLCSPGNPVGQVFDAEQVEAFVRIAAEYACALIVDEVYASSCFDGVEFHSALTHEAEHVFVLGGLSKDFGLAGYAAGWLHGFHTGVMKAVAKQAHFYRLPSPVQRTIQEVLAPHRRREFVDGNRRLLFERAREARTTLEAIGVDVAPAEAGLCLWLDLTEYLTTPDGDGQMDLYCELLEESRVHLSPAAGFYCSLPGYFRICFSQEAAVLQEGLKRIVSGLSNRTISRSESPRPSTEDVLL
ncbi:MAG: pyridoxal phosphate-dependent aminotransferase, partial [Planctomycetota bacterium]